MLRAFARTLNRTGFREGPNGSNQTAEAQQGLQFLGSPYPIMTPWMSNP